MPQNANAAFVAKNDNGQQIQLSVGANANGGLSIAPVGLAYQAVAASQTAKALGGAGESGDVLNSLIITPLTSAAGAVTIIDGSGGTAVSTEVFAGGGTTALTDLKPIVIPLNTVSAEGGWHITTGANVQLIAVGQFTPAAA